MNLALLDPFGRQIPDRIDSTLTLGFPALHYVDADAAAALEPPAPTSKKSSSATAATMETPEWKAAYHVAFNRRGTHIAVGYGSGAVAIYDVAARTLASLYRATSSPTTAASSSASDTGKDGGGGVTSVTWSRRSRTLLAGAAGEDTVQLIDTTHPYGPEDACLILSIDHDILVEDHPLDSTGNVIYTPKNQIPAVHRIDQTKKTSFRDEEDARCIYVTDRKKLETTVLSMGDVVRDAAQAQAPTSSEEKPLIDQHVPALVWKFPQAVGGSLQVHPRRPTAGMAALINGSLILFYCGDPASVFVQQVSGDKATTSSTDKEPTSPQASSDSSSKVLLVPLLDADADDQPHFVTCAAFDPTGQRIFAATKAGKLLGFDVGPLWQALCDPVSGQGKRKLPVVQPHFELDIPGGAAVWHLLSSRNGKTIVLNSADGALRLFSVEACWNASSSKSSAVREEPSDDGPQQQLGVFQDVVSKVKFASCHLSGDGEYLVGGANGDDLKYTLYIWNTSTGALCDKLTGASVQLYSVAWHPTRSFLAVATSDGLVDIWGPRINWYAFAPDFQALPMNVEYIEREDEFDVDSQGDYVADKREEGKSGDKKTTLVDVMTIDPVPVFASDSETEEEVFTVKTRFKNLLASRAKGSRVAVHDD